LDLNRFNITFTHRTGCAIIEQTRVQCITFSSPKRALVAFPTLKIVFFFNLKRERGEEIHNSKRDLNPN